MTIFRLSIASKILIYFLLIALLPMIVTTFILVSSANTQLLHAASLQQQAVARGLSDKVGNYLSNKINNLVSIAELYSSNNVTTSDIDQNLAIILNHDSNMQRIAIVNSSGQDQVVFNRLGNDSSLANEANTDAFKAVNFLSGKAYVSSVSYNGQNKPIITIAVSILKSNYSQYLTDLPRANFGTYNNPGDIQGAVIASYDMSTLWQSVLSTKIGANGYAYVVDGLGNLVAYNNNQFFAKHQKLANVQAVKNFINDDLKTAVTISEVNQRVLSTPMVISDSGWAVIVEEPVNSVYSDVNSYVKSAAIIGLSAIILAMAIGIFFSTQLIYPIRKLSQGAKRFGQGDFDKDINIRTKDELRDLAETFNAMGASIKKLVDDLKVNNMVLTVEQRKLNNIISSVSDGVVAINSQGLIMSANPPAAKLVGKTPEAILAKPIKEIFNWQHEDEAFQPPIDEPGIKQHNDISLNNGNNILYLNLVVSVINNEDNSIAAIITIHDLTQSRELDFMKLDFVAIAAHELRTPLTVVRGYLDMINPEAIKRMTLSGLENVQKAIESTDQLRDLINKLLNIARIERGEMEIFIEKVNLTKLAKENVRQHESIAADKEQRLTFTSESENPTYVPADPSSIVEVLNNLIGNAIKYTPRGGKIKVSLTANDHEARLEVADNGHGIPIELRSKLFTKFYRAERSMIAGTHGTGLGLCIGIDPVSKQGSTFYFTLPVYVANKYDNLVNKNKKIGGVHGWFKKRDAGRRRGNDSSAL